MRHAATNRRHHAPWYRQKRNPSCQDMLSSLRCAVPATLVALLALAPLAAAEGCPNAVYRTGLSAALPDCRAYEMVSPNYTNGGGISYQAIAPDGSAMLAIGIVAFAGAEGAEGFSQYRLERTAAGWATRSIVPSASRFIGPSLLFDSLPLDLGGSLWFARETGQPGGGIGLYAEAAGGSFAEVGPVLPPSAPGNSRRG